MARFELSELAEDDLGEIHSYIAEDDYSAADRLIDDLLDQFQLLANNNAIGKARRDLMVNLRSFPYRKYLILYIPTETGIEIYRVLHMARDIDSLFR